MKILLCCGAGASTSLVAEAMMKSLPSEEQKDYVIEAKSYDMFHEVHGNYDVILLGPQIRYKKAEAQKIAGELNIPVDSINPMDYAMQHGDKILTHARELLLNK
ncbi:PTS sugar transporter subunit IIB [Psychromonas ossibalaenae]|uniref:PTS sugar transporter subunit IIB n=1 Tax=Psychromonas ossibalaenae TaxID=444922 RepID=UPI0003792407|nr:PTS sugar transporter subunit IIB [Psychromonas ossibalaenae]